MFIAYPARVKHPTMKISPAEKARRIEAQWALMQRTQLHADLVVEAVLARLEAGMDWDARLAVFKAVEAEMGKIPTGGDDLLAGGHMPLFRQAALRQVRGA